MNLGQVRTHEMVVFSPCNNFFRLLFSVLFCVARHNRGKVESSDSIRMLFFCDEWARSIFQNETECPYRCISMQCKFISQSVHPFAVLKRFYGCWYNKQYAKYYYIYICSRAFAKPKAFDLRDAGNGENIRFAKHRILEAAYLSRIIRCAGEIVMQERMPALCVCTVWCTGGRAKQWTNMFCILSLLICNTYTHEPDLSEHRISFANGHISLHSTLSELI